jgi:hypothetical protein
VLLLLEQESIAQHFHNSLRFSNWTLLQQRCVCDFLSNFFFSLLLKILDKVFIYFSNNPKYQEYIYNYNDQGTNNIESMNIKISEIKETINFY